MSTNFAQNVHAVLKKVPAIAIASYKSVRYIELFLWEFNLDSAGSLKKCPLLPGVRYIAWLL